MLNDEKSDDEKSNDEKSNDELDIQDRIVEEKLLIELICPICTKLMDICIMFPCTHEFCLNCAHEPSINRCPICRSSLQQELFRSNRNFKIEMRIKNLNVKCRFNNAGCDKVIKYSQLNEHELNCQYHKLQNLSKEKEELIKKLKHIQDEISLMHLNIKIASTRIKNINLPDLD